MAGRRTFWAVFAAEILIGFLCLIQGAYGAPEAAARGLIKLTGDQAAKAGVSVATAAPGKLSVTIKVPGEIRLNTDRLAHVASRVPGVVVQVKKNLGDKVEAGEVMAMLESKDLATAKSAYLATRGKLGLAKSTYEREKGLWEKKISAEQDYLAAKEALAEANIDARSAEEQLRALGLGAEDLKRLEHQTKADFLSSVISSPLAGTIIEKNIVIGEPLSADKTAYVVADLSTVWADFSVPAKDIAAIHVGQEVSVTASEGGGDTRGKIVYMGPTVEQDTRAALARVVLPNDGDLWKPGMFVAGVAEREAIDVSVLVPKDAVQTVGGVPNLFVQTGEGFQASPVTLGRANDTQVEVLSGLQAGQSYAAGGSFILKADLEKGKGGEE